MAEPSLPPADPPVVIFTDGACENNPGPGEWAAILSFGRHRKTISSGARQTTNNRMDLRAVIEGLKALRKTYLRVRVVTDSRYGSESVTQGWLEKWAARGFRKAGGLRKNADRWIELRPLLAQHWPTTRDSSRPNPSVPCWASRSCDGS
jgi:ribonuclease HI